MKTRIVTKTRMVHCSENKDGAINCLDEKKLFF